MTALAKSPRLTANTSFLQRRADDDCRRAVIHTAARAEAPVDVIGRLWPVHRTIALVTLAQAVAAGRPAATVVVGDDVFRLVERIFASADPGNRRHFRPRRTGVHRTTAAATQETVNIRKVGVSDLIRTIRKLNEG